MKMLIPVALLLGAACGDNLQPEENSADVDGASDRLVCDDSSSCLDLLEESLTSWIDSAAADGAYTYSTSFSSFTGFRIETEIDIEAGAPVARRASGFRADEATGSLVPFDWSETGAQLGTHSEGPRPVPLSTLYEECVLEILSVDPVLNEVIFERFPSGALKSCTFRPLNCSDDCTFGPAIESILTGTL